MLDRIVAALAAAARFFRQIGKDALNGLPSAGKWLDDILSSPFRLIFGGQPQPSYTPEYRADDIVDVFKDAREAASAEDRKFDRNVLDSVLEYCRAHRDTRAVMKLSKQLHPKAQAALLTMDDAALRALSRGGISQVKKFVDGFPHRIDGVPGFNDITPIAASDSTASGMPTYNAKRRRIKAQAMKDQSADPFVSPRIAQML